MKNFPTLNWAINVSYEFEKSGVILPYKEYLAHIVDNPESTELLDQMKILIEEEDMIPNFKYVAADIDDDACIYLLTRLRKSFVSIKEHGVVDSSWAKKQIEKIDKELKNYRKQQKDVLKKANFSEAELYLIKTAQDITETKNFRTNIMFLADFTVNSLMKSFLLKEGLSLNQLGVCTVMHASENRSVMPHRLG